MKCLSLVIVGTLFLAVPQVYAAKHAKAMTGCRKGCVQQGSGCPSTQWTGEMMPTYNAFFIDNVNSSQKTGPNSMNGGPPTGAGNQGSKTNIPFICKKVSGRRLAGHVQASLRVAVPGSDTKPTAILHEMSSEKRVDFIAVIDGSNDADANDPARRLGAHAKTIMLVKTWGAINDADDSVNACFDFDLPIAWGVTKIKAAQHSTADGLWFSKNIDVDDIPECVADAASRPKSGRRLDKHAGVCAKVEMPAPVSCLPEPHKPAANAGASASFALGALGAALVSFFSL